MTRLLAVASLLSLVACKGDTGATGPQGDPGSNGSGAPTTGTINGVVSDAIAHDPLADVTVTALDPGGGTLGAVTTASDGKFAFVVAAGPVDLTFAKTLYTAPGVLHSGVQIGASVNVAVTMSEAAAGAPSVSVAVAGDDFGYGAQVPLAASAGSPTSSPLTFTWSNGTSPVLGTVSGTGTAGTITLPAIADALAYPDVTRTICSDATTCQTVKGYVLENRFGVLPIFTDTRGQVTATLVVADNRGQSASASVTADAASVTGDIRNVPVSQRIYLNSGHAGTSAWTIAPPAGSHAALDDPTSRTPAFVPDIAGNYTFTEGTQSITISAGTFVGAIDGGSGNSVTPSATCLLCHDGNFPNIPDKFAPWVGTGHATMFTRGINGGVSSHYSGNCIGCHTVGFDNGVQAGGFSAVAQSTAWTMPFTLSTGNWDALVADNAPLAKLANIQCENCHGPNLSSAHQLTASPAPPNWGPTSTSQPFQSPRISYSAEACATCHGAGSHHIYDEWATPAEPSEESPTLNMGHSNHVAAETLGSSATGLNGHCGRCHTAQGYTLYAAALGAGKVGNLSGSSLALVTSASAEPVTCVACHDPHDASNPNQLRFYGDTPMLPAGFAAFGMGKGAVCITCHNSRNGVKTGSSTATFLHEDDDAYAMTLTSYSAPHQADQGDVFEGRNAYFMSGRLPMTSRHSAIADTCVGCHMRLQPETHISHGAPAVSEHLFRITDANRATLCANCHGPTVDGTGTQGAVEAEMTAIASKLGAATVAKMNAATGGGINVRAYDASTDLYSSVSGSNVAVPTATNKVLAASLVEVHGQISLNITLTSPITIQFVNAAGSPTGAPKSMTTFGVQLGALLDNNTTPTALYAATGNFTHAAWNWFLVEGDQSKGLHNPSFVTAVLDATYAKDVTN